MDKSYSAYPVVKAMSSSADNCEKNIIKIELTAALFVFIANNKINTVTFNGPPPIPRNADKKPNARPMVKMPALFSKAKELILSFFRK